MEILCDVCGHPKNKHKYEHCFYNAKCACTIDPQTIEARYFAKYFYKKYNTTDNIRTQLLGEYWDLAGKYLKAERERKELEKKILEATKALDKISRQTEDIEIAGIASDAMAKIVIIKKGK